MRQLVILFYKILILASFLDAQISEGYTIFSPVGGGPQAAVGGISYLLNTDLEVVHTWEHSRGAASMPYLLADSSIIYPFRVENPSMSAGGVGGGVAHISWDGTIIWQYTISDEIYQHHHDVQPLPNGNILVIAWEKKTASQAYEMGRIELDNPAAGMWSTAIFEIEMIPPDGVNIVWEWHLWDHLVQDSDSSLPGYGVISDHPELMNINYGHVGNGGGPNIGGTNGDWMHINAIDYNPILDQIVISSRHQNEIYIIDHSTTTEEAAGHSGGNSGKGGDFLYRWGNPAAYGRGSISSQRLNAQHGVNWIKEGYPGQGNLILYNNNYDNNSSAVFEISTPLSSDGFNYFIEDNQPFGPEEIDWIYTSNFHSNVQSGAFRLPNGNTLVSVADEAQIFEVDSLGNRLWDFQYPGNHIMIARAQKYPIDFFNGVDFTTFPDYLLGDVNFDLKIDIFDLFYAIEMYNNQYPKTPPADYNEDSVVNFEDITVFINQIMNYSL